MLGHTEITLCHEYFGRCAQAKNVLIGKENLIENGVMSLICSKKHMYRHVYIYIYIYTGN